MWFKVGEVELKCPHCLNTSIETKIEYASDIHVATLKLKCRNNYCNTAWVYFINLYSGSKHIVTDKFDSCYVSANICGSFGRVFSSVPLENNFEYVNVGRHEAFVVHRISYKMFTVNDVKKLHNYVFIFKNGKIFAVITDKQLDMIFLMRIVEHGGKTMHLMDLYSYLAEIANNEKRKQKGIVLICRMAYKSEVFKYSKLNNITIKYDKKLKWLECPVCGKIHHRKYFDLSLIIYITPKR